VTLTFLGTRGNISIRSSAHRMHASLMVSGRSGRVLIDCGADWLGRVQRQAPAGIFITHAHSDHIGGLRFGSRCAVYATAETWQTMARWPLADRRVLPPRHAIFVAGLHVEAWPIEHAMNAPAVGYLVSDGGVRIFYAPDIARLAAPL
jgi:phosphoribosyl 1,2-cyclic phosphodiesterase